MRNELVNLVINSKKKDIFFLTADLGYSVLEDLEKKIKKKFINVGVSENNMMLLAVGLATALPKYNIYVYSIASFVFLRNTEIIRNYIINDNIKNIRIIGVGAGASYSYMGKTHFNFEDINFLSNFEKILILNPANEDELRFVFKKFNEKSKSIYYRINKNNNNLKYKFKRKENIFIKKGNRKNIISSGAILNHLPKIIGEKKFESSNIVSLPILNFKYCKNIEKFLINGDIYCVVDASQSKFFNEIKDKILNKKRFKIFEPKLNNLKKVGSEFDILKQAGLKNFFCDY
jgi:transketolase